MSFVSKSNRPVGHLFEAFRPNCPLTLYRGLVLIRAAFDSIEPSGSLWPVFGETDSSARDFIGVSSTVLKIQLSDHPFSIFKSIGANELTEMDGEVAEWTLAYED